jgi:hypothetical protein
VRREVRARNRVTRRVDKQGFRAIEECVGAFRPTTRLEIPFDRLDAVAIPNAGIGKQARKRFKLVASDTSAADWSILVSLPDETAPGIETAATCKYFGEARAPLRRYRHYKLNGGGDSVASR